MVVYTAITAGFDLLREPAPAILDPAIQFRAFLDSRRRSRVWRARPACSVWPDPRLNAKYHKVLAHLCLPREAVSLWIDGNIEICPPVSLAALADRYLRGADMAVFRHRQRTCIYQEAIYCLHQRLDKPAVIRRQVFRYTREGFPANHGLAECSVLLRRHTPAVREFNEFWWREIQAGSIRDQISFPYVAWKTGIKINYFPGTVRDGTPFLRRPHRPAES